MRWRFILAIIFMALSLLFTNWPENWTPFLEVIYGEQFYPYLSSALTRLPQPNNFALMDILWLAVPIGFLIRIWWLAKTNLVRRLPLILVETLLWLSTGYLLFMLMWGLNYHRTSLYAQLKTQGFTTNLVNGHWEFALNETLSTLEKLPPDFNYCKHQSSEFSNSRPAAFAHSAMSLANLTTARNHTVTQSAFSTIYTRLGIAGVYIPFTAEPTYSRSIFGLSAPFVMTHEFSHFAGFAHEYDADIIAYWSLWMAPDPIWQYSAWLEWWMAANAPHQYYDAMPSKFKAGITCYSDYLREQSRWQIRKYFWHAYEINLKNQGINEGLKSYEMGEAMALSSYQDWLSKKRNR